MTMDIMAFHEGRVRNTQLMLDLAKLHYIPDDPERLVLDCTYGLGRMWNDWTPRGLVRSDLFAPDPDVVDQDVHEVDFTDMPWKDDTFHAVVFDPPYKLNGTSTGLGPSAMDKGYGVAKAASWQNRHALIRQGMKEGARVLKRAGHLMVKCQDQVSAGKVRWQSIDFSTYAEDELNLELVDMLYVSGYRAQPADRRQLHARRNYSTMLVLRKR